MGGGNTGIELGIVRGISYGVFGAPGTFMPQVRELGSRLARVYFTWNQIEPQPGTYDWTAVDALLGQLEPGDKLWITVVTASRWATKQATDFLPASMPRDFAAYQLFLGALVSHCRGAVAYWQCNNEPSNAGLWSGSAGDYAELAATFARTVRHADPDAEIVLGGCGFDVLGSNLGSEQRMFFHEVLGKAGDAYVFPHAIWHGPSPNRSGKARKTILYNYCQMFMRAYDFATPYAALFERCTPRQRRLLGDLGHDFRPGDFFYAPEDQAALMTGTTPDP